MYKSKNHEFLCCGKAIKKIQIECMEGAKNPNF